MTFIVLQLLTFCVHALHFYWDVAFTHNKVTFFDRERSSQKVSEFTQLRQLNLVEEFKPYVHGGLKVHLEENKFDSLNKAAYDLWLINKP